MQAVGTLGDTTSRQFLWEEFSKMGIDPEKDKQEFNKFQSSLFSWSDFTEYWFNDPMDEDLPLILDPAQRDAIDSVQFGYPINNYPWVVPETKRPKEIIMIWPRQFGKCNKDGSLLVKSTGELVKVENLKNGDKVLAHSGDGFVPAGVKVFDNGNKRCLRITTKYGRVMECTTNHPFLANTDVHRTPNEYVEAQDLSVGDRVAMARSLPKMGSEIIGDREIKLLAYMIVDGEDRNCIHINVVGDDRQLLIDHGLSGKLSGEKFVPPIIFKSSTRQVALFLSKLIDCDGYVGPNMVEYYSKSKQLIDDLSHLFTRVGMYGRISHKIIDGDKHYRLTFTSTITIENAKRWLTLCPRKQRMLDSLHLLGHDHVDTFPVWNDVKRLREEEGLTRRGFEQMVGFKTSYSTRGISRKKIRKIQCAFPQFNVDESIFWDEVVSIEDIGEQHTWGVEVEKYHNHITNGFVTHNTTAVALAAACAFIFMEKRFHIATFSLTEPGAIELLERIKVFIRDSPFAWMIEDDNKKELHKIGGKVKIVAYPASDSVRGRSVSLGLVDEAAYVPENVLKGAILHTMRRAGKRWILLSTPAGAKGEFVNHFRMGVDTRPLCCLSCGVLYKQDTDLMKRWIPHFTAQETMFKIPGNLPPCPDCGARNWTYGIGEYTVVPVDPFNCSWKTKEEILHELDLAGWTPLARQELLGEIIYEGSNVFSRVMLQNAVDETLDNVPSPDRSITNYVAGVDFGKIHDASVINVMHYDWDRGKAIWDYMETIGGEYDTIDYHDIRDNFINIILLYNPLWVVPDATGVGDSVVDEMWEDIKRLKRKRPYIRTKIFSNTGRRRNDGTYIQTGGKKKGFHFSYESKKDLIDNLINGYAKRLDIAIPPYNIPEVHEFWDEMMSFAYELTANKRIKYGVQTSHDDRVIAHALAYYVVRQKPFISLTPRLG